MSPSRVLFIDAYDSFTNNIVSLIETELNVGVTTIHIDDDVGDLGVFLNSFDAVIAGPGPGSPDAPNDIGLISRLWCLKDEEIKPVLGVCLGFQSLVYGFGGRIERLSQARHGISTQVETQGKSLFEGLHQFQSIQYHSLHASIGETEGLWQPSELCPDLLPLAWDLSSPKDGAILMSICHKFKPFWGIQFHPESICSSIEARKVIKNWWSLCIQHNERSGKQPTSNLPEADSFVTNGLQKSDFYTGNSPTASSTSPSQVSESPTTSYSATRESSPFQEYACKSMPLGDLDIPQIVERLDLARNDLIVLDSERKLMPNLGRFSIIAILEPTTTRLTYQVNSGVIRTTTGQNTGVERLKATESIFTYLKHYMSQRKITGGIDEIPFWGGLIGYITYEVCLETINVSATSFIGRDDMCFAFVERSVVIDHITGTIYIQSIKHQDEKWANKIYSTLYPQSFYDESNFSPRKMVSKRLPVENNYKSHIADCQEQIRAGNSYELCLTNQAMFTTYKSSQDTSWQKYQTLRKLNPAPFGSYIRLGSATILSTSPERFMCWTRPSLNSTGEYTSTCQFRPIKGTVQKKQTLPDGSICEIQLEDATKILSTAKETAENLMIVDLIRHDLHGVVGSGNVRVPSLMQVEEYSTVFQLVSVIEGDLHHTHADTNYANGIDVLASSLPPGSMTGAPKKRACEILRSLEDEPRSIYSGVIGYMCVGGGGDFSVTIRTVFKWDDEEKDDDREKWRIGAGGAITILSDLQGEWDEMNGKLSSTKRLFE